MTHRTLSGRQSLLRIFAGDFDRYRQRPLYQALLEEARASDLAGCTIYRAAEGFGKAKTVHSEVALEGAGERPILVELVDEPERVAAFFQQVEPMLGGALVTEEDVFVHQYQTAAAGSPAAPQPETQGGRKMTDRNLSGEHRLLRIFFGESDKAGHTPLHMEILKRARSQGLAGCTALRGLMGFGASSVIHTDHLFRMSSDLPMVLEIVDTAEKVKAFLDEVSPLLQGALVTEEKVTVHRYSSR